MSHRKFEHPRCGHLGFKPRKRAKKIRGRIRSFPKDDTSKKPHLTAFMGQKVGLTHISRAVERAGSYNNGKDIAEVVTLIETPPMTVVGVVGYKQTSKGNEKIGVVWAKHLAQEFIKRVCKSKNQDALKGAQKSYQEKVNKDAGFLQEKLNTFKKEATCIRVIAHTNLKKTHHEGAEKQIDGQKKAHVMEIQVNGGTTAQKVDFASGLLEKNIPVDSVFEDYELLDTVAVTTGKGFKGVISRWHTKKLPRKTHKGLRKVGCIGAWHPSRILWTVARAGQKGFHHRTERNKRIQKVGKNLKDSEGQNGSTEFDITKKSINPMGGFKRQGLLTEDFLMIKGTVQGPIKRNITLRKSLVPQTLKKFTQPINLKFIDTASKVGKGRFQTSQEKLKFFGWRANKNQTAEE